VQRAQGAPHGGELGVKVARDGEATEAPRFVVVEQRRDERPHELRAVLRGAKAQRAEYVEGLGVRHGGHGDQ
jgi:hypothetical protein